MTHNYCILFYELLREFDLEHKEACLGNAIYCLSNGGTTYTYITKDKLSEMVCIKSSTFFVILKKLREQGLVEKEPEGTGWKTTELWNKTYEKYRDKYHPNGFDDTVDTIGNWYVNDRVGN